MFPKFISIGPLTLHFYGLIIAAVIYLGYWLARKRAHLFKIPQKLFDDPIIITPLILGIIGARFYHVLDYWEVYKTDPWSIINISGGGLGIFGALAGIFVGFWLVAKIRQLNFLSLVDLISPPLILGQAVGRFGNWINQEGFGPPTNLPWGVYISPENRPLQFITSTHFHPTFFYEAILDAIFFIVIIRLSKQTKHPGQTFALYLILYSIGRFAVEFFRIDTAQIGTIKVAHLLSITILVVGFWLLLHKNIAQHPKESKG